MVWMTGCAVFNLKLSLSLLSAEVEGWNLRLNVFCRRIKYVEIWQLFPIKKKKSTKMILYFVGSLLTPQSFQSYSLEIVSYSLFSWFWGCFGLKELYHHQTDSDEVRRHADAQWAGRGLKARKGIYFTTGCKCCRCGFCVCDCRISDIFVTLRLPFSFLCSPSGQFGLCC